MAAEAALVARRCMEAQETGHVDLSNCDLMEIPQALYLFLKTTKVTSLNISNNQLKRVPAKFGEVFPYLVDFDCSNNLEISTLPKVFSTMNDLSHINLSHNKFLKMPSISGNVKILDLSSNIIEDLTVEEIESMHTCECIKLSSNNLSEATLLLLDKYDNFKI